jgi:hypothetical protein
MPFQSSVALNQGFGVPGDIVFEGPTRATPGVVKVGSGGASAADIVVGRAFTIDAADGQYYPGGTGVFGGILANSNAYASYGTSAGGSLAPTLVLPAGEVGEFLEMGEIVVQLSNAAAIGAAVCFVNATGALKSGAPGAGETAVPNAKVVRYANAAAGLAVVRLTN